MNKIIIAIDGHSSTGKSTLAKQLAKYLNYKYIDTGAMYRAITWYAIKNNYFEKEVLDEDKVIKNLEFINLELHHDSNLNNYILLLNGENIEKEIRGMEVSSKVSYIAKIAEVREKMVEIQQAWGNEKGIVMDGRDIGTVVFPNAELKIFMTASAEVRAQRRYDELIKKGDTVLYDDVLQNVIERDEIDSNRTIAPLKPASDAIMIDNSNLTREEQFQYVLKLVKETV
ncbi:UMP/CMP kinase [Flavobacteriaceae bacterium UJ101]|nr:UMP/CMP kinase [Flavobacteriaceae bacterium UJ101]